MENYDFSDIAPYEGKAFEEAVKRLKDDFTPLSNFTDILSRHNRTDSVFRDFQAKKIIRDSLDEVHSFSEFQDKIDVGVFLNMVEHCSIDKLTYGGITELGDDKPHIYISNHRDIVLDCALLDLVLSKSDRRLCEMVIGDNLLVDRFVTDLFKVSGAITIKRNASSATELRDITLHLSRYLTYCHTTKKNSIWIAQKSGRNKDGIDNTSPAVLKMLYLASREQCLSFSQFLEQVSIVPVAISYQYDPCAVSKAFELLRNSGKKVHEDVVDMVRGMRMEKGNVHIQMGTRLSSSEIEDPRAAVENIDAQIHKNYKLWDTNWFCYDFLNGNSDNKDKYKDLDTEAFIARYRGQEKDIFDCVMNGYANPVRSAKNEKNI